MLKVVFSAVVLAEVFRVETVLLIFGVVFSVGLYVDLFVILPVVVYLNVVEETRFIIDRVVFSSIFIDVVVFCVVLGTIVVSFWKINVVLIGVVAFLAEFNGNIVVVTRVSFFIIGTLVGIDVELVFGFIIVESVTGVEILEIVESVGIAVEVEMDVEIEVKVDVANVEEMVVWFGLIEVVEGVDDVDLVASLANVILFGTIVLSSADSSIGDVPISESVDSSEKKQIFFQMTFTNKHNVALTF